MKRIPSPCLAAALLACSTLLATPALADVLFERPLGTNGATYQSAWLTPDGLDWDAWCWDQFSFAAAQTVTDIEWYGTFANDIESFAVSICPSIGGGTQPDVTAPPVRSWTVPGTLAPTFVGTFGGVPIHRWSFHLPQGLALNGATTYWLQIEAAETAGNGWSWAAASGSGSHFTRGPAFAAGDVSYYIASSDLAFRLLGATLDAGPRAVAEFSLEGAIPNPARGSGVRIACTLPDEAPATLELLDLAGRRIASVNAACFGPGRHVIDLASSSTIAPGLYFARLTQGAHSARTRVVVTR